jgi:hypothetical protein
MSILMLGLMRICGGSRSKARCEERYGKSSRNGLGSLFGIKMGRKSIGDGDGRSAGHDTKDGGKER